MKKILAPTVFIFVLMLYGLHVNAQANDSMLIKEAAVNYVEGYYKGDAQRMAKALSFELAKRIIAKDSSGDAIQNMGYSLLLLSTRKNKKSNPSNSAELFKADVTIYDIGINIATVKIVTNKLKFIDYAQLGRINGEWKIINVLWEYTAK